MMETIALHHGRTEVKPEEVGFDPAVLQRLNDHYASLTGNKTIQGASYVISRHGKVFAHTAMGKLTHKEESLDLLPGSIRKTYSITKIITAAAIMQLIERGLIYLHQPVSSLLKPFDTPMHREITIFHLLTHTSGLRADPGYYVEPHQLPWFEWMIRERKKNDPATDWIQVILAGPVLAAPGKEWHYSTVGYAVLGEIISRISKMPYHLYIQNEILSPLRMEHSFFLVPPAWRDEVCVTGSWEDKGLLITEFDPEEPPKAGNGMYSTLPDLLRFGQMLLSGGTLDGVTILSKRSVEMMTQNHLSGVRMQGWGNDEENYRFGLGFSLDDFDLCTPGTFNHEGYGHSGLYVDPVEQLVFAFLVPSTRGYMTESVLVPKAIVWSGLTASFQTVSPQEATFRQEVLVRLEQHFQNLVQEDKLQCASYLLAKDGRVFASGAIGKRTFREDDDSPMLTDTIRRIASVTKLFGATAIFQLIEQGKLFLRQPVAEWIEEFKHPMFEKIQIWHLLTHTSGLWPDPGYFTSPILLVIGIYGLRSIRIQKTLMKW